jgi:hypothetical protein
VGTQINVDHHGGFGCGADVDGNEQHRAGGEDEPQQHHTVEHRGPRRTFMECLSAIILLN